MRRLSISNAATRALLLVGALIVTLPVSPGLAQDARPPRPAQTPEAPAAGVAPTAATAGQSGGAWLGVWLEDAVDGGVEVVAVVPGGPAELARLRPGDIILRANQSEIPVQDELRAVLARLKPGDPLELQLLRAGEALNAHVQLVARAQRPPAPPASPAPPTVRVPVQWPRGLFTVRPSGLSTLGLTVAAVTPALRTFYGAPEDAGVLVTRAEPEKLAGRAGIRVGDILVKLDERKLESGEQLEATLRRWRSGEPISAELVRDGKVHHVVLAAGEGAAPEVRDSSEQRQRERELLTRRLRRELDRLELRIEEIRTQLKDLEDEP